MRSPHHLIIPSPVAVMVLTTVAVEQAPESARYLLRRTRTELAAPSRRAITEMLTTIMAYRFEQLSRVEVEAMLDMTLKETKVYREIKEEGREVMAKAIARLLTKRLGELP
nr:Rpn family recombination-promoting nuclease/putative transposase [Chroococcidiopsis sp. CCMEE 29]